MKLNEIQMECIADEIMKWYKFEEYKGWDNPIDVIIANMYDGGDEEILEVPEEYTRQVIETSFNCMHSSSIESIQANMPEFNPVV